MRQITRSIGDDILQIREAERSLYREIQSLVAAEKVVLGKEDYDKLDLILTAKNNIMHKINTFEVQVQKIRKSRPELTPEQYKKITAIETEITAIIQGIAGIEAENTTTVEKMLKSLGAEVGTFEKKKKLDKFFSGYKNTNQAASRYLDATI